MGRNSSRCSSRLHANEPGDSPILGRRRVLALGGAAVAGATGLAGCIGDDDAPTYERQAEYEGVSQAGTSWEDLPDLHGQLTIYSGRREEQIGPVFDQLEEYYDDLTIDIRYDDNEVHVQQIDEEGENSPADLLYTQDSGTLGALAGMDRTVELSDDVLETVPETYRDPNGTWTGVSGRTRCVAFNTDTWDADELPDDIFEYPNDDRFVDEMGWRVDSGSFLAFVRAMMIENGDDTTREFIEDMQAAGIQDNEGGSTTPDAVVAGEISIGFVNQYYVGRLLADRPDASIDVTFTDGDVGSLFNVSGVAVVDTSDRQDLAVDVVRHLLGTEGQEFFVDTNREYAVIEGVEYVGELPTIDEINPPAFDLNQLADVEPAVDLLRDVGLR